MAAAARIPGGACGSAGATAGGSSTASLHGNGGHNDVEVLRGQQQCSTEVVGSLGPTGPKYSAMVMDHNIVEDQLCLLVRDAIACYYSARPWLIPGTKHNHKG